MYGERELMRTGLYFFIILNLTVLLFYQNCGNQVSVQAVENPLDDIVSKLETYEDQNLSPEQQAYLNDMNTCENTTSSTDKTNCMTSAIEKSVYGLDVRLSADTHVVKGIICHKDSPALANPLRAYSLCKQELEKEIGASALQKLSAEHVFEFADLLNQSCLFTELKCALTVRVVRSAE